MVDEPLEQPVNHVLKQYELLEITGLQDACTIKMTNTTPWRMNLCAASQVDTCIFYVAMDSSVYVYRRNYRKGSLGQPIKKIETKGASSQERDPEYTINSIKVGQLLDKEVLATVAENGHVSVWLTEDLDKDPLVLQHEVASTWGLAIHRDGLLAVATNNKKITVFNVLQLTKSTRMFEDKDQKRERRNVLKEKESIDLIGHEHNIPTIDFSDSGKYIASCSIDRSCRIWDLAKEKTIAKRKTPITLPESLSWGWCVKFIPKGNFKHIVCDNAEICQTVRQKILKGRSVHLSSLGMRHSAALPVYRFNAAGLESDLEGDDEPLFTGSDYMLDYDPDDIYDHDPENDFDNQFWPDHEELLDEPEYLPQESGDLQGYDHTWQGSDGGPDDDPTWQGDDGGPDDDPTWQGDDGGPDDDPTWQGDDGGPDDDSTWQGDDDGPDDDPTWGESDVISGFDPTWQGYDSDPDDDPIWQGSDGGPDDDPIWRYYGAGGVGPDADPTWPESDSPPSEDPTWPESNNPPDDDPTWQYSNAAPDDGWPASPDHHQIAEWNIENQSMGPPSETSGGVPLVSYTDDHSIGSEYDLDPTLQRPEQMPLGFSDWGDTDRSSVASEYTPNNLNWEQPQSRTFRQTDSDNLVYQEYRRMRNRTLGAIRSTQGESSETNIDSNDERVSPTQEPLRLLEQLFRQSDMEDTNTPRPAEDGDTSLSNPWNEETSGIVTGPDVDNIFRSGLINSENIRIQEILDIAFGSHMTRRNAQLHDRLFHSSTGGNWDNNYSPEALQNLQEDSESESEEEASIDHEISDRRVPNVVRSTNPTRSDTTRGLVGKQKRREIGEYLVFTTAKDVYLLNPTRPRITTIRVEHEAIAKIDVRSDRMLQAMDRINMVEWIPEIELLVVASQKGVVALTRVLQVELDDGRQTCLFNNECYLPLDGLQPNPLYGMTVQRIVQDHIASPIFHLYLFYYDGTVLGYKLSRNKTVVDVNSFIV